MEIDYNPEMTLLDYLLIEQPNKETQITLGKLNHKYGGNLKITKLAGPKIMVQVPQKENDDSIIKQMVYKESNIVDIYVISSRTGEILLTRSEERDKFIPMEL